MRKNKGKKDLIVPQDYRKEQKNDINGKMMLRVGTHYNWTMKTLCESHILIHIS